MQPGGMPGMGGGTPATDRYAGTYTEAAVSGIQATHTHTSEASVKTPSDLFKGILRFTEALCVRVRVAWMLLIYGAQKISPAAWV